MAYEDLSTFTEVINAPGYDRFNVATGTPYRLDVSHLEEADNTYVYKDYGVNYFQNYEINVDAQMSIITGSTTGDWMGIFKVSNSLQAGANTSEQSVYFEYAGSTNIRMYAKNTTGGTTNVLLSGKTDTTLYLKIYRIGTKFVTKVYPSNSDRTNDSNIIATLVSPAGSDTTNFRYLYCGYSENYIGYTGIDGFIENLEIVQTNVEFGTQVGDYIGEGDYDGGLNVDAIFVDDNGYIHISGHRQGYHKLYYQVSTDGGEIFTDGEGGASGSYKEIPLANFSYPDGTAIVVDSGDNVYLFFQTRQPSNSIFLHKKIAGTGTGTGWQARVDISSGESLGDVYGGIQALIDENDNIVVTASGTWSGRAEWLGCWTSDDGGSNWTKEFGSYNRSTTGGTSDLAISSSNHGYLATSGRNGITGKVDEGAVTKITRSAVTGGYEWVFGSEENFLESPTGDTNTIYSTAIIAERTSEVIWEFVSLIEDSTYKIKYNKKTGGSWGSWQTLVSGASNPYVHLYAIRDYDDNIYLTYNISDGSDPIAPIYMIIYEDDVWGSPFTLESEGIHCILQQPPLVQTASRIFYIYEHEESGLKFVNSYPLSKVNLADTIALSDEIELNLSMDRALLEDTINLNDEIELSLSLEKSILEDTIVISDSISFAHIEQLLLEDSLTISDEIEVDITAYDKLLNDSISLTDAIEIGFITYKDMNNDFRLQLTAFQDISNKINTALEVIEDIDNKFNSAIEVIGDINEKINTAIEVIENLPNSCNTVEGKRIYIDNDIRTLAQSEYSLLNDFRMIRQWQRPGSVGFQSKGKEYIKVYIGGEEQIDVTIDSISFTKVLNASHDASFILGRPYDNTKPALDSTVEIKYDNTRIYYGYIVSISPTDNPESIRINCKDYYWNNNKNTEWFYIGHPIEDEIDITNYTTIKSGLNALGINWNIGDFIPQRIDAYGDGRSDAITSLITQCGNFGWFYDEYGNKKLWTAGRGSIVNIAKQYLGQNIGLYQILDMNFTESIDSLVNRLRVNMGTSVTRITREGEGETTDKQTKWYSVQRVYARPSWDTSKEVLAQNSANGYGFNYHSDSDDYSDVFRKYQLITRLEKFESWSDMFPPIVQVTKGFGTPVSSYQAGGEGILKEGFSVDYEDDTLTLNEPFYYYTKNDNGEMNIITAPVITLIMYKIKYVTLKDDPNPGGVPDDLESIGEMTFLTKKIGDYSGTVTKTLNLAGLSMQSGQTIRVQSGSGISTILSPSWNDTELAKDIAYWNLSNSAHKKIEGTIRLTLDAVLFYNLDLSKRIQIQGVTEYPLNIISMTYNLNDFTVTLNVSSRHYYKRTVSLPSHGEGINIIGQGAS